MNPLASRTLPERIEDLQCALARLVRAVKWMRELQTEFQDGSNSISSSALDESEQEVDDLVKLHLPTKETAS